MSYAFSASPIDFRTTVDLEMQLQNEKKKLDRNSLQKQMYPYREQQQQQPVSMAGKNALMNETWNQLNSSSNMIASLHQQTDDEDEQKQVNPFLVQLKSKEDRESDELIDFYRNQMSSGNRGTQQNPYMLIENQDNVEKYNVPKTTNSHEVLQKINQMLEILEEQREIKTQRKNEEIIVFSFIGIFTIFVLDSFVSIGRYSR
jgi:hypothetical protein